MTVAPRFDQYSDAWSTSVTVDILGERVGFFHTVKDGVDRVWVDHPSFLEKVYGLTGSKLYGARSGADYTDNQWRFRLFSQAALEALTCLPFSPGEEAAIVCNDWHSALLPVLLKDHYQKQGRFQKTKVALCIHNIAFQGRFWRDSFGTLHLPASSLEKFLFEDGSPRVYTEDEQEAVNTSNGAGKSTRKYAKINWLKAGILACDKVLTVSPNYATEIASNESLGVELDHIIRQKGSVEGIVNGMDVKEWDPSTDKFLTTKFDADSMAEGKAAAKAALQQALGLAADPSVPLYGFIGRLEEQKGVDVLIASLAKVPPEVKVQVAILGTGKKALESEVEQLGTQFPGRVKGIVEFSAKYAHLITAGADFMLVPSRFEPCGLIQLHAMNYGTVPLVASTGGLVDTVKEGTTGFHIGRMDPDKLVDADAQAIADTIARAAEVHSTPQMAEMREACIDQDLSWAKPARKWEAILEEMMHGTSSQPPPAQRKAAVTTPVNTPKEAGRRATGTLAKKS
ncbi:hypothetical protein WJX73_003691 [Symbiochloris irregularis]|uniref:Starch synthase, chloroplastic/amyloplastic n=1 Tax=Symbiochloris irregularis TaxID=706552 RepID=A0AAW1NUJ8_9CHLO